MAALLVEVERPLVEEIRLERREGAILALFVELEGPLVEEL